MTLEIATAAVTMMVMTIVITITTLIQGPPTNRSVIQGCTDEKWRI
jgi:hypothetical protein